MRERGEVLIRNWNTVVSPNDEVYHLGDVGLCNANKLKDILNRLNGKIYLIRGNHEKSAEACKERFEWIKDYHELIIPDDEAFKGKQLLILFHYAMRVWQASHYGTYQLYGHSHGKLPDDTNLLSIDIGVDCHNFTPINYDTIKSLMNKKTWTKPSLRGE